MKTGFQDYLGREICAGDIIVISGSTATELCKVVKKSGRWVAAVSNKRFFPLKSLVDFSIQIIGNAAEIYRGRPDIIKMELNLFWEMYKKRRIK